MSQHPKTVRPLVIAAVMASMAMVAIEATIVSTAMPQIVTQLGGLHLYSWVFSSFLLAQTAMTVVFGKLADLYGRKPIVLIGIAIFLVGSVLAGFAWSMPAMIVFRLIQGIGAGAIQPVTLTIVGDLYPARERGKIQGYLASVWAIAAVVGPMAGGLLIRDLSWAWIFWINIPIGLASAAGFIAFLHEHERRERPSIDYRRRRPFHRVDRRADDGRSPMWARPATRWSRSNSRCSSSAGSCSCRRSAAPPIR